MGKCGVHTRWGRGTGRCLCGFLGLDLSSPSLFAKMQRLARYQGRVSPPSTKATNHFHAVFITALLLELLLVSGFCSANVCGCSCCKGERSLSIQTPHRDLGRSTFAPERPIELQTFPALQNLRLESVPLEHVEGKVISGCPGEWCWLLFCSQNIVSPAIAWSLSTQGS